MRGVARGGASRSSTHPKSVTKNSSHRLLTPLAPPEKSTNRSPPTSTSIGSSNPKNNLLASLIRPSSTAQAVS
ncbi:hypothetical protein BC829DRAFT_382681 [Chytridium lagenaria]|nr:hypothetical protein BC829DRAFT_382681 [Chytridium lagenaria]